MCKALCQSEGSTGIALISYKCLSLISQIEQKNHTKFVEHGKYIPVEKVQVKC